VSPDTADHALTVPGYEIQEVIARTGRCVILRARDVAMDREVAIKVLQPHVNQRRLLREAQITIPLEHPGIVPLYVVGQLPDGRGFFVMKLIRGATLEQLLNGSAAPATERGRFLAVFEQVCQTLAYAQARGVIHRNLKPSKVMFGSFGEVLLLGWGLARVTTEPEPDSEQANPSVAETGLAALQNVVGTPLYMPPEQARGEVADTRSDVFGLGGILCAILTGEPPFPSSSSTRDLIRRAAAGDLAETFARLDTCGAAPELIALAKRCLAPNRADRPADAAEVACAVATYRAKTETVEPEGTSVSPCPVETTNCRIKTETVEPEGTNPEQKRHRRQSAILVLLLVTILLLLANAVALWWPR
jgi:serine/threonine protein kinase